MFKQGINGSDPSLLFVRLYREKWHGVSDAKKVAITRSGFLLYCLALGLVGLVVVAKPGKYTSFSFKVLIQGMNV